MTGRKKARQQQRDARRSGIKALTKSRPKMLDQADQEAKIQRKRDQQEKKRDMPAYTSEQLLGQAQQAYESTAMDLCIMFCERVLESDPQHEEATELMALAYLAQDNVEQARALLEQAVAVNPDSGPSKYMYLGQMSYGEQAAELLGKGIELMAQDLDKIAADSDEDAIISAQENIAAAFCSLAEVYLTDLCEVDEAQETCLVLMQKALEYDASNVNALQTLATIHMSMSEPEAARGYLYRSLALWWPNKSELGDFDVHDAASGAETSEMEMDDDDDEDENVDNEGQGSHTAKGATEAKHSGMKKSRKVAVQSSGMQATVDDEGDDSTDAVDDIEAELAAQTPSYEGRINVAKLLVELEDYSHALTVLDMLIAEDDTIMQVWYLQGWTLYLQGDREAAKDSLERARGLYLAHGVERPDVLQHIDELLPQLAS